MMEQRRTDQTQEQLDSSVQQGFRHYEQTCGHCPLVPRLGREALVSMASNDLKDEREMTADGSWGDLSEEFTTMLRGKRIHVRVYARQVDDAWVMFTTVDADTNSVINAELSPI